MPTIFFPFSLFARFCTQKKIHWTSISVFDFVFALKSISSSKKHFSALLNIDINCWQQSYSFWSFLVCQKQLWLHKHWSIGTVHIYFSIFGRLLRLTIILLLILKEEKKIWNVIRKRKNLPIESNENSFDECYSPTTVTLQYKKPKAYKKIAKHKEWAKWTQTRTRNGMKNAFAKRIFLFTYFNTGQRLGV